MPKSEAHKQKVVSISLPGQANGNMSPGQIPQGQTAQSQMPNGVSSESQMPASSGQVSM